MNEDENVVAEETTETPEEIVETEESLDETVSEEVEA
jgi:hypothetical protein